jgi:N-succinyldiaminopimelate aminotransferase
MAYAINLPDLYYETLIREYSGRRNLLCEALEKIGFRVYRPEGTYYVIVDITSHGFEDDVQFCRMLPKQAGVAAIPCSCFWENRKKGRNLVRFCFCKKDETLKEGIRRLTKWLKE